MAVEYKPPPPDKSVGICAAFAVGRPSSPPSRRRYVTASRPSFSLGTEKAVSIMPRGAKIRSCRNSSSCFPDTTSTNRPSTSVDTLYSQWVLGWCLSGSVASLVTRSARVFSLESSNCACEYMRSTIELPKNHRSGQRCDGGGHVSSCHVPPAPCEAWACYRRFPVPRCRLRDRQALAGMSTPGRPGRSDLPRAASSRQSW